MYILQELFIQRGMLRIKECMKHCRIRKIFRLISRIRLSIIWDRLRQGEGRPIGSAGPTTASRMDKYTPQLLDLGMGAMIGKGKRTQDVIDAVIRNGAVYFAAVGGAGALLSKCITKSEVVAYDDLGTEAIRKLQVENFPVIVVIDSEGNNLYESAIKEYCTYKNE